MDDDDVAGVDSDGDSVEAVQYDGSSASANRVMDLIGTRGVNNTELGLLTPIGYISRGSWVIKNRSGAVSSATDAVFQCETKTAR